MYASLEMGNVRGEHHGKYLTSVWRQEREPGPFARLQLTARNNIGLILSLPLVRLVLMRGNQIWYCFWCCDHALACVGH